MKNISRRQFLKGTFAGAAGLALSSLPMFSTKAAAEEADAAETVAIPESWDYETDIVVVGAGMSGLAAAVEGLNNNASVIVLEAQDAAGGNGNITSCIMGVGSDIQKKLGIEVTPADILSTEMETFNYSVDGVRWYNVIKDSASNIQWLIDQGVLIQDDFIDNYLGFGVVNTAHWWVGETKRDGATGYVAPMCARIEELGGTILTSTAGKNLVKDESGAVIGILAETADGTIAIKASAVILATGGYADNTDLLVSKGYDPDLTSVFGMPGHNGDGIDMALAAGAKSWMDNSSLMEYPANPATGFASMDYSYLGNCLWVNQDGLRFVNENCHARIPARAALAVRSQEKTFEIMNEAVLDQLEVDHPGDKDVFLSCVADGNIYQADTIEELAALIEVDADTLKETLASYNTMCENKKDTDFGKSEDMLLSLAEGPYYACPNYGIVFLTTIGGIDTTKDCQVRSAEGGIIPNLYAVGVDGVENYKGLYTITIPGSCDANNIWSGRHAAQMAVANL